MPVTMTCPASNLFIRQLIAADGASTLPVQMRPSKSRITTTANASPTPLLG
jgi:hypothetical protein